MASLLNRLGGMLSLSRKRTNAHKALSALPVVEQKLFLAMASAAKSDGALDQDELATISTMLSRLTGEVYAEETVSTMVLKAETLVSPKQFRRIGKGLVEGQKLAILKAAHAVVGPKPQEREQEFRYLNDLAEGLGLNPAEAMAILNRQPKLAAL